MPRWSAGGGGGDGAGTRVGLTRPGSGSDQRASGGARDQAGLSADQSHGAHRRRPAALAGGGGASRGERLHPEREPAGSATAAAVAPALAQRSAAAGRAK